MLLASLYQAINVSSDFTQSQLLANKLCCRCRQRKLEFVKHLVETRRDSDTKPEQKFYHVPVSLCLLGCDVPEKHVAHSVEIGIYHAAAELN